MMRAKLTVTSVKTLKPHPNHDATPSDEVTFNALYEQTDDQGFNEDNSFALHTPAATLNMLINNPDLVGKINPGDQFYVDFSKIEK